MSKDMTEKLTKTTVNEEKSNVLIITDQHTIRDKIYEISGVKVMLDFEFAEID